MRCWASTATWEAYKFYEWQRYRSRLRQLGAGNAAHAGAFSEAGKIFRFCVAMDGYGLVGSGGRAEPADRGTAMHDPVINVDDDGEAVKVSVSQCRGISPSGDIIEISPSNVINGSFPKSQVEGYQELGVYIVCEPHDKVVEAGYDDPANPQIKSKRRQRYRLKLNVTAAESAHSLMISRLRKAEGGLR